MPGILNFNYIYKDWGGGSFL